MHTLRKQIIEFKLYECKKPPPPILRNHVSLLTKTIPLPWKKENMSLFVNCYIRITPFFEDDSSLCTLKQVRMTVDILQIISNFFFERAQGFKNEWCECRADFPPFIFVVKKANQEYKQTVWFFLLCRLPSEEKSIFSYLLLATIENRIGNVEKKNLLLFLPHA